MRNSYHRSTWLEVSVIIILAALAFGLALLCLGLFLEPRGRVSCADLGSYDDIVSVFHSGNPQLDRDHDGIPCENRKIK